MRYAAHLRTSRRDHILKHRAKSGLVTWLWFLAVLALLFLFVNFAKLSPSQMFIGFAVSLWRTTTAYLIALVGAVILAFTITANRTMEDLLLPIFDVLQSFPSFALFPVLVEALKGQPELIIIFVLVITMIWPILFTIIGAMKNRREDLEEAATIFGATGSRRLWNFTLPELLPSIVTGSIVGWGEGWEFIIGAELLVHVRVGVGTYLGALGDAHENGLLFLGIVVLMALLYVLNRRIWLPLLHHVTQYESET